MCIYACVISCKCLWNLSVKGKKLVFLKDSDYVPKVTFTNLDKLKNS